MSYDGLPPALRITVVARDAGSQVAWERGGRCRWCGRIGPVDVHHIDYRRGASYDREDNLISLCRPHHNFVHGIRDASRRTISKQVAQQILLELIQTSGQTGAALWRIKIRAWQREGRCEHGELDCLDCPKPADNDALYYQAHKDDPGEWGPAEWPSTADTEEENHEVADPGGRLRSRPSEGP